MQSGAVFRRVIRDQHGELSFFIFTSGGAQTEVEPPRSTENAYELMQATYYR